MAQENINLDICYKNLLDGAEPVSSGLVAIAVKRIIYAGSVDEAPEFPNALVIDLPEATLLPHRAPILWQVCGQTSMCTSEAGYAKRQAVRRVM